MIRILGDLFRYAAANKKLWLLPLLLVLILVGSLLIVVQNCKGRKETKNTQMSCTKDARLVDAHRQSLIPLVKASTTAIFIRIGDLFTFESHSLK